MKVKSIHTLADALRMAGFLVTPMDNAVGYSIQGKGVRGKFCEAGQGDGYTMHDGKIALDHNACYDKPQKCPLVMKLPLELDELFKHIEFLGSSEGYDWSNSYAYEDDPKLPRE